jgi:hypothetical protein
MKKILNSLLLMSLLTMNQLLGYDLCYSVRPGVSPKILVVAHGMGGNYEIANTIPTEKTIVGFNFPDHDYFTRELKADESSFGTIEELIPLLLVLKQCVLIDGHQEIDLYGRSAGGGAVVNTLVALYSRRYDRRLESAGISSEDKKKILHAIQRGMVILDAPLKSIEEIIDFRGLDPELEVFAHRYQANDMEPIEALKYLEGISLRIIVHFQVPDEILSNRDDQLFFDRLKTYNALGTTQLSIGDDGGHSLLHPSLWDFYKKIEEPPASN